MTIMDLLNTILKNPEEHPTSRDMGQVVTIDMEHDAEILKNELSKDESHLHSEKWMGRLW